MRYRLMATYHGVPYEVGLGPSSSEVVLFAACPPPEELGFEPATGHWRKQVIRAEIDALWESRPVGTFRGEPCIVLDDPGERLHIAYIGTDADRAVNLGYWQVDRGVFELLAPREEVTALIEERVDKPLRWGEQADQTGPMATYPYGRAPWPIAASPVPAPRPAPAAATPAEAVPAQAAPATDTALVDGPPVAATLADPPADTQADDALSANAPLASSRPAGTSSASVPPADTPRASVSPADTQPAGTPPAGISRASGPSADVPPASAPQADSSRVNAPLADPPSLSTPSDSAPTADAPFASATLASAPLADVRPTAVPSAGVQRERGTLSTALARPAGPAPAEGRAQPPADTWPTGVNVRMDPYPGRISDEDAGSFPDDTDSEPLPVPPGFYDPENAALADSTPSGEVGGRAARRRRVPTREIFCELADLASIPRAAYALETETDGAMCLLPTPDGFDVFIAADGVRHELRSFADEEAAYFYLFGVLVAEAIRSRTLTPAVAVANPYSGTV